jgi:vancomycin resistance protein YoaR
VAVQGRDRGGAALRLALALAVLAAGYIGMAVFLGQHVPANASVAGIPIGGKSPEDAEATLKRQLAERASAPVSVVLGARTVEVDPAAAGLTLDIKETLQGLTGFSLKPADVWNHLNGGDDEPLRTDVARDRLRAVLTESAKSVDKGAQEGSIAFPGGKVRLVAPVVGAKVQVDATAEEIARAWPASAPVKGVVEPVEPKISAEELNRVNTEFATPAMSGPVRVAVGSTTLVLQPADFAPALSLRSGDDGKLVPSYDTATLLAAVRKAAEERGIESKPRDASFTLRGGKAVVVPSATGLGIDQKSLVTAFGPALTSPNRTATVKTVVLQPDLTTAEARKIAPREPISTFTTYFPDNPPRTNNIKIAARTLNGTFVAPGKQFSLNETLGQRTAAKGYAKAPVIENGRLVEGYGGGVSQVSTTLFNAVFFSGARIEEYHPHSFYISRYPEGREATVSWPGVDQKWTNDTGTGILIQAYTSGNALTVTFHGAKVWDIEAVKGPRRNVVKPKSIVDKSAACVPQQPSEGFDVTVTRIFKKNGAEVKRSSFSTHYIPEDKVTCTNPK